MKVASLIKILEEMPKDAEVVHENGDFVDKVNRVEYRKLSSMTTSANSVFLK